VANLLLTNYCNRSCPYCFAREALATAGNTDTKAQLAFDDLVTVLDFLDRSSEKVITFLGGEPTLHPRFSHYLRYALLRGFLVRVFTNGLCEGSLINQVREIIDDLELNSEQLRFMLNVNEPSRTDVLEKDTQEALLRALGPHSVLSLNVYHSDFDISYHLQLVERFDLVRSVRVGLAQPIAGGANAFLSVEDYKPTLKRLVEASQLCHERNVVLALDCGFPLCLWTDTELGILYRTNAVMSFKCGPCVDIGPDLSVWHCFPLGDAYRVSLSDFADLSELRDHLRSTIRKNAKRRGIFDACDDCVYYDRGQCSGGCLAHRYAEARSE
jgi:radical SAM protein with 4Fe4S-binding SPASM domain